MGDTTKIEWTDHTFNPWIGCTKVSPGCAHCYAEQDTPARVARAKGRELWGKGKPRQRTSTGNWKLPIRWNTEAIAAANLAQVADGPVGAEPRRQRVFCASQADWLDDEVPIQWLADLLDLISSTPYLDWQLLTKRPENFWSRLREARAYGLNNCPGAYGLVTSWFGKGDHHGKIPKNIWIGVSVENQAMADERIPLLQEIPAGVRFLSCEPLLESVNFNLSGIDWVIVGGESGPEARPCSVNWIRTVIGGCTFHRSTAFPVAVFVKQLGSNVIDAERFSFPKSRLNGDPLIVHPKGGDPNEWPQYLRVREFPAAR